MAEAYVAVNDEDGEPINHDGAKLVVASEAGEEFRTPVKGDLPVLVASQSLDVPVSPIPSHAHERIVDPKLSPRPGNIEKLLKLKDDEIRALKQTVDEMRTRVEGLASQCNLLFGMCKQMEDQVKEANADAKEAKAAAESATSKLSKLRKLVKENEKTAKLTKQSMTDEISKVTKIYDGALNEMQRIAKSARTEASEYRKSSKSDGHHRSSSKSDSVSRSSSSRKSSKASKGDPTITEEPEKRKSTKWRRAKYDAVDKEVKPQPKKQLERPHSRPKLSPLGKERKSKFESQKKRGRSGGEESEQKMKIDDSRKKTVHFGTRKVLVVRPSELPEDVNTYPTSELRMQYAHGYNGHDVKCRANLYKRGRELIFNIAATTVCHNIDTNNQRFFTGHTEDVTSIALHPTKNIMATGQQDEKGVAEPKICVWNLDTLELLNEFEGDHHGFVYHLEFSKVSGMLYSCAGDDEHSLVVYDGETIETDTEPAFRWSPVGKTAIFGLTLQTADVEDGCADEFITYGKKHLKSWKVKFDLPDNIDKNNPRKGRHWHCKGSLVPTSKASDKKKEKNYQSAITLPFWPRVYVVGGQSGRIYLVHNNKVKKKYDAFEVPVACLCPLEDGFIATSYQGVWVIWKQSNEKTDLIPGISGNFSSVSGLKGYGAPRSLLFDAETQTIYAGSRRNQVFSVNISDPENPVGELHVHGAGGEVWGLACHPTQPYFVTGGYDGYVTVYDIRTNHPVKEKPPILLPARDSKSKEKICCATWSSCGKYIAVGTEMSKVFIITWEPWEKSQEIHIPLRNKNSEIEQVGVLLFNPASTVLAAGHFDSSIYMFGLVKDEETEEEHWEKWSSSVSLTSACTHLQFSEDSRFLKSFGRDYYLQTWEVIEKRKKVKSQAYELDPDHVKMAGNPLIAGWDVEGVLQPGMDGTDINTCAVTHGDGERLLVCGDDFGKVWLHRYPALDPKFSRSFDGHSAFVVDVDWTYDDSRVVSVGGGDRAIFVWERTNAEQEI